MREKENSGYIAVFTTLPDKEKAKEVAGKLVGEGFVACVNLFPVESIYSWKGKIEDTGEYLLIMKSRSGKYKEIEQKIKELHPYDVPEIISCAIDDGFEEYLNWIDKTTGSTR